MIPEKDGILNGKWFSSKANMSKLNKSIDDMCMCDFNVPFMTGSKKKGQSVENLKEASMDKLLDWWNELNARESDLKAREDALKQQRLNIQAIEEEAFKMQSDASERLSEYDKLLSDIENAKLDTSFEKWASSKQGLGIKVKNKEGKTVFKPINVLETYKADKAKTTANLRYRTQNLFDIGEAASKNDGYNYNF